MANRSQGPWNGPAWQCRSCRQSVKATANFCPTCGASWETGQGSYYQSYTTWTPPPPWKEERAHPRARSSPRRRTDPSKGKGKGKHKAKTESNKLQNRNTDADASVPNTAAIPAPPAQPHIGTPKPDKAPEPQPEEKKLIEQLLKHVDVMQLPQHLQEQVGALTEQDLQHHGKRLHKLVAAKTAALKGLRKIRSEMGAYHSAWEGYTTELLTMWQKQTAEREKKMEEFYEAEQSWVAQLKGATQALQMATQASDAKLTEEQAMDISEAQVDDALEEEQELRARQQQQKQATEAQAMQIATMLEAVKRSAATSATELRDSSRTPRRKPPPTEVIDVEQESPTAPSQGAPATAGEPIAGGKPFQSAHA